MKSKISLVLLAFTILSSCSSSKTIKFANREHDVYTTENLKEFLATNKNPKVVLRVSNSATNLTEMENVDYLYNAIENQLLSSGFIVRDRQLFNQIIENESNNIDYEKIKEKSDTDLIIELTKLDPMVEYVTNAYYDDKGRKKTESFKEHKKYGANVEFKVVSIQDNEYAGRYMFHYAPCQNGCKISSSKMKAVKRGWANKDVKPYEGVEQDELENFMKNATKMLVEEMRS